MDAYLLPLIEQEHKQPGNTVLGTLVKAFEQGDEVITQQEMLSFAEGLIYVSAVQLPMNVFRDCLAYLPSFLHSEFFVGAYEAAWLSQAARLVAKRFGALFGVQWPPKASAPSHPYLRKALLTPLRPRRQKRGLLSTC